MPTPKNPKIKPKKRRVKGSIKQKVEVRKKGEKNPKKEQYAPTPTPHSNAVVFKLKVKKK